MSTVDSSKHVEKWTLAHFLVGQDWSARHARIALPVLVSKAEEYRGRTEAAIPDFTYGNLAALIAEPKYAHPMHFALGSIGYALKELEEGVDWKFGKIPPIQLLVWSDGKGSPGDDAFIFIGISSEDANKMPTTVRQFTARSVRANVLGYPHWREVLSALGLKPLGIPLPTTSAVVRSPEKDHAGRNGGGESKYHRLLKCYLAIHYQLLGVPGEFTPRFEVILPSGDVVDLILDDLAQNRRVCVEAKSRISAEEDIIRGIFQCIKYRAVLDAQEKYDLIRDRSYKKNDLTILLVTERDIPQNLKQLCKFLQVSTVVVEVPDGFAFAQPNV